MRDRINTVRLPHVSFTREDTLQYKAYNIYYNNNAFYSRSVYSIMDHADNVSCLRNERKKGNRSSLKCVNDVSECRRNGLKEME